MKKLLYCYVLLCATVLAEKQESSKSLEFDIKGIKVKPEDIVTIMTSSAQAIDYMLKNRQETITKEIEACECEKRMLAKQRDQQVIGQHEFEESCKTIDKKIERLTKRLNDTNNTGKDITNNVQHVFVNGLDTVFANYRETEQRKTAIVVAATTEDVRNKGVIQKANIDAQAAMDRLKFMSDPENLKKYALFAAATTAGVVGCYYSLKITAHYVDLMLEKKPRLIDETSRVGKWDRVKNSVSGWFNNQEKSIVFDDIIMSEKQKQDIVLLAQAAQEAKSLDLPYQNILFYGPPGTGKTLTAKEIAKASGMDYALLSGSNIVQFIKNGTVVQELQYLFDWAEQSAQGLLVFIDEADVFLCDRTKTTQEHIEAIEKFLSLTGTSSKKCMFIFATNFAEHLDPAVTSRIHTTMKFDLPDRSCRKTCLELYSKKYITNDARMVTIDGKKQLIHLALGEDVDNTYVAKLAEQTNGFSYRDIAFLFQNIRTSMYAQKTFTLHKDFIEKALIQAQQKQNLSTYKTP